MQYLNNSDFILKLTTFSQNLYHLSPKGKCTTLARNRSHNGGTLTLSSWPPAPASLHPVSSSTILSPPGLTRPAPSSHGFLESRGEPRLQAALAALLLSSSPGSPTFFLASRVSPSNPLLPSTRAHSAALRPGPHCLVRSVIARLSCFHSPTGSGVRWSHAPRFQSTRRRLLMPKAASRNAPCSASPLQVTRTRKYCVTHPERVD